jgi:hypothetical protein
VTLRGLVIGSRRFGERPKNLKPLKMKTDRFLRNVEGHLHSTQLLSYMLIKELVILQNLLVKVLADTLPAILCFRSSH